jgi:hypothetical protein
MEENKSKQLKYSDLLVVWKHFGLSPEWQSRCLPAVILSEHGDALSGATQELIDVSIRCELDGDSYTQPAACRWCAGETGEVDKNWTYGHRRDWWVCSRCKRVYPCRHANLDEVNEIHLTGICSDCGLRLPYTFVAEYLYKMYKGKAEQFQVTAEACRERDRLCREREKARSATRSDEEFTDVKCALPIED